MPNNKTPPNPINTRGRKGSLKEPVTYEELTALLNDHEKRMRECFRDEISALVGRMQKIEDNLEKIQFECVNFESEVSQLKEIITKQQMQIESHEQKLRANNIIVHNIPESDMSNRNERLKTDEEKLDFVCRMGDVDVPRDDVFSIRRIGKRSDERTRPIKVVLRNAEVKFQFLNKRKMIATNRNIMDAFHNKVFVNPDNSFLVQKEEYRLRQKLKEIKSEDPNVTSYIRSGVLYSNGSIVDKIDIRSQMF